VASELKKWAGSDLKQIVTCVRAHTHTHTHTHTHMHTHIHAQAHTRTHRHPRAHTYTHRHTRTHTYTYLLQHTRCICLSLFLPRALKGQAMLLVAQEPVHLPSNLIPLIMLAVSSLLAEPFFLFPALILMQKARSDANTCVQKLVMQKLVCKATCSPH
jgi:hypothetical protein